MTTFDHETAHRHFAAECFNRTWALIDRHDRTAEDDRMMVAQAHASLFHWRCRPDHTARHLAIGTWQISRVYAILGFGDEAARFAEMSLEYSAGLDPFVVGYAYEALCRAARVRGDGAGAARALEEARAHAGRVTPDADRALLLGDLDGLA